jgi:predicted RNase H-like nuclease
MRELTEVVGVDGCRDGWIAVAASPDLSDASARRHPDIASLVAAHPGAVIVIDMPIGLADDEQGRGADAEARALLGPRRSSVFTPPCRDALYQTDYAAANAAQRRVTGKGLSKQSWMIAPKMREVDRMITPELQGRIVEGHPEVAFMLAGGAPMAAHKSKLHGLFARMRLLAALGLRAEALAADLPLGTDAQPDDLVDACILAVVGARTLRGEARRLPIRPRLDRRGLAMEIWG